LFNQQVSPLTKGAKEMLIKYNFVLRPIFVLQIYVGCRCQRKIQRHVVKVPDHRRSKDTA